MRTQYMNDVLLFAFIVALPIAIIRGHPNRSSNRIGRDANLLRPPVGNKYSALILFFASLLWTVYWIIKLGVSNLSDEERNLYVFSGIMLAVGLYLLFAYRNWYVRVGEDSFTWRTMFGRTHTLMYCDVVSVSQRPRYVRQILVTVWGPGHLKFQLLNSADFVDLSPLLDRLEQTKGTRRPPLTRSRHGIR
jgi:hypothetical protein